MDVNRLLKQFDMMQQLTKQLTRGRMPRRGGLMHGMGRKKSEMTFIYRCSAFINKHISF